MTPIKLGVVVVVVFLIGALWSEVKHLQREKPLPLAPTQKVLSREAERNPSPSVTPISTSTPKPTFAPTHPASRISPVSSVVEAQAYFEKMSEMTNTVTDTVGEIGEFMRENPDFTSWTDQERVYYVVLTSIVEKSYEEVQTIKPPAQYKMSYNLVSAGLKKYAQAMPLTRQGIDEGNTDKIYRSISLIEEGSELFNQATEQIVKERSSWKQQ